MGGAVGELHLNSQKKWEEGGEGADICLKQLQLTKLLYLEIKRMYFCNDKHILHGLNRLRDTKRFNIMNYERKKAVMRS